MPAVPIKWIPGVRRRKSSTMRSSVETIREHIEALRLALLAPSPEGIEQCLPALAGAAESLISIQRELNAGRRDPELGRELKALEKDLAAVDKLIERGAAFWNQWARLLGSITGGYTPSGEARPVAAAGTISLRG
jgi:hypothetical protein